MSCLVAKPVVDGLERDLKGQAEVLRVSVTSRVGAALAGRYGVRGVPTLLLFDGAGQIVHAEVGVPDREAVAAAVAELLGE
jgi:thioredoxin-like negative regulator of GroEL